MVDMTIKKLFKKITTPNKYISEFVKKQRALTARAKIVTVLWASSERGTYVRKKHGELR